MFRNVQEKTIGRGVLRTFAPDLGEWETIVEGNLDILGKIDYEGLIDSAFGTAWIRHLIKFLTVIGYVGSTFGFLQLVWMLYQKYAGRGNRNRMPRRGRRGQRARGSIGGSFYGDGPPPYHRDYPV